MNIQMLSFAAVLVAAVGFGAGAEPGYAAPADFENKTSFADSEVEEARAYSNAKWEEWLNSSSDGGRAALEKLRLGDASTYGNLSYINNSRLDYVALRLSPPSSLNELETLIRMSPVSVTSVKKEFFAHIPLSELETARSPLGGGSTEALYKAFDSPSKSVTFRHFLDVNLTPGLPTGMDPLQTLTVKITVPEGGFVAYLGEGKALLPVNTFMGYDLRSLKAPAGSSAYQLNANVYLPEARISATLRDQDSSALTKLGRKLGIIPDNAPSDALRIDTTGFRGPVVYMEARDALEQLTNRGLYPKRNIKSLITQTFKVNMDNDFRIRFTGEAIRDPGRPPLEVVRKGYTSLGVTGRLDMVLNVRNAAESNAVSIAFVHELMHAIDLSGEAQYSPKLADAFSKNLQEFDALVADEGNRLGTYWKSGFTGENAHLLEKIRKGTLSGPEKAKAFPESFAEFGRFALNNTTNDAGRESLADYFRGLAPNIAEHIEGSLAAHLRLPDACGGGARSAVARVGVGSVCGVMSEEELAEVHRSNLASEEEAVAGEGSVLDGVEFVTDAERLEAAGGQVLSPLTESSRVFAEFESGAGVDGVKALAGSLEASLAKDLGLLGKVSADAGTVSKALSGLKKLWSKASELLPYVAIVATGYALSQDIQSGDWVDAGFDGVAEALMAVGLAQPELMVFTEPALWVDMAAQYVVDKIREPNTPLPVMPLWQRGQAALDYQKWQGLPDVLAQSRLQEMQEQLEAAAQEVMREKILPALQARLASDVEVLDRLRDTYLAEAYVAAANAGDGGFAGAAWDAVQPQLAEVVKTIDEAFAGHEEQRRQGYAVVLGEQVQAVADHFGLEWPVGSVVFEEIRVEFDRVIARPTVETMEGVMAEYSRFQNPPISYPLGDLGFRQKLVDDHLAAYEAKFSQLFSDPWQVTLPNDAVEYRRLLDGADPTDTVPHPLVWGAAVPGGVTEELRIHDPKNTLSGVMTVTAPEGTQIQYVVMDSSLHHDPGISVSESRTTATIGSPQAPVDFGGAGATVIVRLQTAANTAPGRTLSGTVTIDQGEARLSAGRLDVVVRDTIPAGHGFAVPGGVTEEVVFSDTPGDMAGGVMTLTAPPGTTFETVTNDVGAAVTISADKKTATVARTPFGPRATVRAQLRVPLTAKLDTTFTGGRILIVDEGVVQASGALTVSTQPVTFSQRVTPSLPVGGSGDATVRIQNHASATAAGIAFTITAPSNTVFTTGTIRWKQDNNNSSTLFGSLSGDGKTITYTSVTFQIGPNNSWVDLTVKLKATTSGTGTINDGVFTITGGGILPTGGSTPLAYTAVVTRIPTASGEAGPGKTVEVKVYDPNSTVTGTMTLKAPAGTTFASVSNNVGATVTISTDRKKATISRTSFGGAAATVWAKITLPTTAVPNITYTSSVTVTDNNATVATGSLSTFTTIDGCITATEHELPISLVVWLFPVELTNNCYAKIDARVIFGGGTDTNWQTIPAKTSAGPGSETYWSTPYARYDHYQTGTITRP